MNGQHCLVWIDHEKARLVFFDGQTASPVEIAAANAHEHGNTHHKAGSVGAGKSGLSGAFAQAIEAQLKQCHEFIVAGPGPAKLELVRHIHRHLPDIDKKMVGVESLDSMSDAQLAEFARGYFRKYDRLHSSNDEVLAGLAAHRQPSV